MLSLAQINPPIRHFDVPGIMRAAHQAADLLIADFSGFIASNEGRFAFKKALDLCLSPKASAGIPVERFSNNRSIRLVAHQHLAVAVHFLIAIANRRMETPVSVHRPRPHTAFGLLGVLLALVLGNGGKQILNQDAVRVFTEVDGRAFQLTACFFQCPAQHPVAFDIASKAADIIDDNDDAAFALFFDEGQKRAKGRAIKNLTRHGALFKDLDDLLALTLGIVSAACRLRFQAVTFLNLAFGRDARVQNGFCQADI
nr:hypothetical protein [uncultured Roseobacter sp.]